MSSISLRPSLGGIVWTDAQDNYWGNNGFDYFNYPNKAIVKNAIACGDITPSNTIFAYVAVCYSNTLTILNATRPWAQTEYSYYPVPSPHDIQLVDYPKYGRIAFVCSYTTGEFFAVNVTNPDAMSMLDSRDDSNNAGMYMDIDIPSNILYYTDWNETGLDYLYAYNITDPHHLTLLCKTVVPRGKPWSPKVNDLNRNYVYVACEGEGPNEDNGSVALFNVTWVHNQSSPSMQYIKTQGFGSYADLRQNGKYLYGESGYSTLNPPIPWALHIWDVSDPTNLTTVSVTDLQTYGHFCLVTSPSGYEYAFVRHYDVVYGDYGVNIVDINDKTHPMDIGYIPDDGGGHTRDLYRCHWMQCAFNNITHSWVLYVIGYMDNSWVTFNISFNSSAPVASFTHEAKGLVVTFDGSSSYDPDGSIVSWDWAFGDSTEGTGAVITHTYSAPGAYNVTLTVTDTDGLTSSLTQSITVMKEQMQKALIVGKISHISTLGDYITFDAVRIRVLGFFPFNYTVFSSGEPITIMKTYHGFLGARAIVALCSRLLS